MSPFASDPGYLNLFQRQYNWRLGIDPKLLAIHRNKGCLIVAVKNILRQKCALTLRSGVFSH